MIKPVHLPLFLTKLSLAAAVLAGCASPEPRYYTLAGEPVIGPAVMAAATQGKEPVFIELAPIRVPERLNRSQLVLGKENGTISLMEQDRWLAPLPDELRDALSQGLQANLGAVDVYRQRISGAAPVYRITVEVLSMEAELGARAGAVIRWTVQRSPGRELRSGHTQAELPAPGGVPSVVSAYRQIVISTASDIATAIRALQANSLTPRKS